MSVLHLDWETRSVCDLGNHGHHIYAKHPTTDILMAAYSFDDGPVKIWSPHGSQENSKCPEEVYAHISSGGIVGAHNAGFEIEINKHVASKLYGWPELVVEQCEDTMVMAYSMGLPGALKNLAPAIGLKIAKDMAGSRIMLKMCKPRSGPEPNCKDCDGTGIFYGNVGTCHCVVWWMDDEMLWQLFMYGATDVIVEREIHKRVLKLSKSENKLWHLDYKINNRGVPLDLVTARKAHSVVEAEKSRLDSEMDRVTNNVVAKCSNHQALKKWINNRGVETNSVDKSSVELLLEKQDPPVPEIVRQALELKKAGGKTSNAKIESMLNRASKDGRARGILQFAGAASTQRWAGRGIQFQNMPRPHLEQDQIEHIIDILNSNSKNIVEQIRLFYGDPLAAISSCLRALIKSIPETRFLCGDFGQVEARMVAWLAGDDRAVKSFMGEGKIYENRAARIYQIPVSEVTKMQRQIGKVATLSLGFGGGVGAFQKLAKNYQVYVDDKEAEYIKDSWRSDHPIIVAYWKDIERAALHAVKFPGKTYSAGPAKYPERKILFKVSGFILFARLPSGRLVPWPYPEIGISRMVEDPETGLWRKFDPKTDQALKDGIWEKENVTYKSENSLSKKFERKDAWYGLFVENIVQAICRDLLAHAMTNLEAKNYPIYLHVHDENLSMKKYGEGSLEEFIKIMKILPPWAADFPLAVDGWEGERYRK